jgi:crotonobetainyl-CoA:carnitine CoA-transferase CaiB-like acyl-CoA transferase
VLDGLGGTVDIPRNPMGYERPNTQIPQMGEHTVEVLRTELGCSDTEIRELLDQGALGDDREGVLAQLGGAKSGEGQ